MAKKSKRQAAPAEEVSGGQAGGALIADLPTAALIESAPAAVTIRRRSEHPLRRCDINPHALKVVYRLLRAGYEAYLVGGCVRDLLLGRDPKDFDVSTSAHPNQIKRIFRNCWLIGKRFRLAHIRYGETVIETSTFRSRPIDAAEDEERAVANEEEDRLIKESQASGGESSDENGNGNGNGGGEESASSAPEADLLIRSDNTFGNAEEDAVRRDFTINGLFYDVNAFSVIDYVGGLRDLEARLIRCIGDPYIRFREDPVRMLRAVRFASRLGFTIEDGVRQAMVDLAPEICRASPARLFEEVMRLFAYGSGERAFRLLHETGLLQQILPVIADGLANAGAEGQARFWQYMALLDEKTKAEGQVGQDLTFATMLLPLLKHAFTPQASRGLLISLAQKMAGRLEEKLFLPRKKQLYHNIWNIIVLERMFVFERPHRRGARQARQAFGNDARALFSFIAKVEGLEANHCQGWFTFLDEGAAPRHERQGSHQPREDKAEASSSPVASAEASAAAPAAAQQVASFVSQESIGGQPESVQPEHPSPVPEDIQAEGGEMGEDGGDDAEGAEGEVASAAGATANNAGQPEGKRYLSRSARRRRSRRLRKLAATQQAPQAAGTGTAAAESAPQQIQPAAVAPAAHAPQVQQPVSQVSQAQPSQQGQPGQQGEGGRRKSRRRRGRGGRGHDQAGQPQPQAQQNQQAPQSQQVKAEPRTEIEAFDDSMPIRYGQTGMAKAVAPVLATPPPKPVHAQGGESQHGDKPGKSDGRKGNRRDRHDRHDRRHKLNLPVYNEEERKVMAENKQEAETLAPHWLDEL